MVDDFLIENWCDDNGRERPETPVLFPLFSSQIPPGLSWNQVRSARILISTTYRQVNA